MYSCGRDHPRRPGRAGGKRGRAETDGGCEGGGGKRRRGKNSCFLPSRFSLPPPPPSSFSACPSFLPAPARSAPWVSADGPRCVTRSLNIQLNPAVSNSVISNTPLSRTVSHSPYLKSTPAISNFSTFLRNIRQHQSGRHLVTRCIES